MAFASVFTTFKQIRQKVSALEATLSSCDQKVEDLRSGIRNFLSGASKTLLMVAKISRGDLTIIDNRIQHRNHASFRFSFAMKDAYGVIKESITNINGLLKTIASSPYDQRVFLAFGQALDALYVVYDKLSETSQEYLISDQEIADLTREKEACLRQLEGLKEQIRQDVASENKFANLSMDEYLESDGLVDGEIPIGRISKDIDLDFYRFAKEAAPGFQAPGLPVALNRDAPSVFIESDEDLLHNDYFDSILETIIQNAFLHFKAKNLQLACIEDRVSSPVLKPIMNNLSLAVSSSLLFSSQAANDESAATALLGKLFEEYNDRISKFKSFRAIAKNGRCDNIYEYNEENPTEPVSFILFVFKDFPSFNKDEQSRKMLTKILEGGKNVGIFTILLGQNTEVKAKFMSDRALEALDLSALGIPTIQVRKNGVFYESGEPFVFAGYELSKANYLTLLKKRLDNSSKFFIDQILEEEKDVPFYDRIKIPVGESNGRKIYYETSTEAKPYPFSIVTGSTGSGKSAFVHTLMMSAAYKYSPQEVEIHLVDFKSADKSTDFDGYRYVPGQENLYIPHVKYVSLKSRPENAVDVTNYIIKLMAERSRYGKFREYNQKAKPEDRIPQIYVIIDEYENMIKGGDGLDDNSIEKINLVSQINTNIETILKRARVFGIGVIFAGQDFTLKGKAPNQINTRFAFYNSESTLRACFPEPVDNFSKFPSDKRQSVGYCYVGSEGDTNPQYAHIAYAGGVESERLHKLAKKIREKYQSYTDQHIQMVIGGNGFVIPEKDSYHSWKQEIEETIESVKMGYDGEEEFASSGAKDSIELLRPLALGQSASSNMIISVRYAFDNGKFGYYAFASKPDLCRLESNLYLAFLYETRKLAYDRPRVVFLDAGYGGVKQDTLDDYCNPYPFLGKEIEYISGPTAIAEKLLELSKFIENKQKVPYLVILHGLDFLVRENAKKWLDQNQATPEKQPSGDEKQQAEFKKQQASLEQKTGIKPPSLLSGFLAGVRSTPAPSPKQQATFTYADVIQALKNLYLLGSRSQVFLFVGSDNYLSITRVLFDNMKDVEKDLNRFAIYGSFEMFKNKTVDAIPNANTAYIFNDSVGSTVRLFNYKVKEASSWWDELRKGLEK